jgi:hypothetical protein
VQVWEMSYKVKRKSSKGQHKVTKGEKKTLLIPL